MPSTADGTRTARVDPLGLASSAPRPRGAPATWRGVAPADHPCTARGALPPQTLPPPRTPPLSLPRVVSLAPPPRPLLCRSRPRVAVGIPLRAPPEEFVSLAAWRWGARRHALTDARTHARACARPPPSSPSPSGREGGHARVQGGLGTWWERAGRVGVVRGTGQPEGGGGRRFGGRGRELAGRKRVRAGGWRWWRWGGGVVVREQEAEGRGVGRCGEWGRERLSGWG